MQRTDETPGAAALQRGDLAAAIRQCDEALARDPQSADAHCNRARARRALGDLGGVALADAAAAIRINPQHAWAHRTLGDIHVVKGNLKTAIACCDQAIRLDPSLPHAYNTRAGARLLFKEYEAALRDCNEAIRLGPDLWGAYITRGNVRYHLYDVNAVEDYRRAFQMKPAGYATHVVRIIAGQVQHELDYLFTNCAEHLLANPQDSLSYVRRGVALLLLGRDAEAQCDLDQAVLFDPTAKERVDALIAKTNRIRGRTASHP